VAKARDAALTETSPPDASRRRLLSSFVGGYAASLIPWALAQPAADADHAAFLALSAILAGRPSLDLALGTRLHEALAVDDPGFPAATRALLALIGERQVDPMQLQALLDGEHSPLALLPRRIVSAWYLGIVGEGEHARCVAFETALTAAVVADVLKPPTYCYGVYGSWARKPV
jgi:hypothetical protein